MENVEDVENGSQQQKEFLPKWMRYLPSRKYMKATHRRQEFGDNASIQSVCKKRLREVDPGKAMNDIDDTKSSSASIHIGMTFNMRQTDGISLLFGEENRHDALSVTKKARKAMSEVSSLEVAKLLEFCDFSK